MNPIRPGRIPINPDNILTKHGRIISRPGGIIIRPESILIWLWPGSMIVRPGSIIVRPGSMIIRKWRVSSRRDAAFQGNARLTSENLHCLIGTGGRKLCPTIPLVKRGFGVRICPTIHVRLLPKMRTALRCGAHLLKHTSMVTTNVRFVEARRSCL